MYHINKMKDKIYMIISIDTSKAFDKIQLPFMIKNSQQTVYRRSIPQHSKAIYNKPTGKNHNGEKLKAIPLRSGTRQGCSCFPLLFSIVLEVLAKAIRGQKEIKSIQIRKEGVLQMI